MNERSTWERRAPARQTLPEQQKKGNTLWRSRGYLPHIDQPSLLQFITFRLADTLPRQLLRKMEDELRHLPKEKRAVARHKKIEAHLDSGTGCCALQHPAMAKTMQDTLLKFDGEKYHLVAWCIMPNHVHVLIKPEIALGKIVQSWKSYTGRWALQHNAELGLGVPGRSFWMREYWDRYIREENHFRRVIEYIHHNPVKAGLCNAPEKWAWSSASQKAPAPAAFMKRKR